MKDDKDTKDDKDSEDARPPAFRRAAFLVAAWALLVGVCQALRPILPIDETRYLSVAWEMWLRGDLLVPYLNGLPYSEKPPLLFWLIHLGWWAFGVNGWWPRLVPALFGLANLFLAGALARRLWPDRPAVARAAPAVLLGFFLWSLYTTLIMFDMLVTFCVLLALLGIYGARVRGGTASWGPWGLAGAALGLGVLAKGPVALVVPLFVALLEPWWGRDLPRAAGSAPRARWWPGLAGAVMVAAVVALAWALPAAAAGGAEYGRAILLTQTEERIVAAFAHQRPWWWYLPFLPLLAFPYALWPPLWKAAAGMRPGRLDAGQRFCLAALVPGLAVFSLISGKQPHYLLPLCPALALLAARLLEEAPAPRRRDVLPSLSALVLVGTILLVAPPFAQELRLPTWSAAVSPGIGSALLLAAAGFVVGFPRIFPGRPAAPTLISLVFLGLLHAGFAMAPRRSFDLTHMARYLAGLERQGRPVAFVGAYHGQFHFLGRLERPFDVIHGGAEHAWLLRHPDGRVIQDLRYLPRGSGRPELTQPYRDGLLAVWAAPP